MCECVRYQTEYGERLDLCEVCTDLWDTYQDPHTLVLSESRTECGECGEVLRIESCKCDDPPVPF